MVEKYTRRTQALWDRSKNVFLPRRVNLDSVWTHSYEANPGFTRNRVHPKLGVIHHYRKCRPEWIKTGKCLPNHKFVEDNKLKIFVSTIRTNILQKRKLMLTKPWWHDTISNQCIKLSVITCCLAKKCEVLIKKTTTKNSSLMLCTCTSVCKRTLTNKMHALRKPLERVFDWL